MSQVAVDSIVDRKYLLLREIGVGGSGTVFEAQHRLTERKVALKVMRESYAKSRDAARRFLREVRLATELRHPHVVEVLDAGQDADNQLLYIAMELLEGYDFSSRLAAGNLTRAEGVRCLLDIIPALALAHERGVVHRDLKPENLFLARQEDGTHRVKLLDFGIARSLSGVSVTQTGVALGTPLYMSPEQALSPHDVDARADVWALGVMLYEVLVGEPPFYDESPHALVLRAAAEPHVPLAERIPDLDPHLSRLVDRCLEKERNDRIGSVLEVQSVLEAVLRHAADETLTLGSDAPRPLTPTPPERPLRRTLAQAALSRYSERPRADSPEKPARALSGPPQPSPTPARRRWVVGALVAGAIALLAAVVGATAFWLGSTIDRVEASAPEPPRAEPVEPTGQDRAGRAATPAHPSGFEPPGADADPFGAEVPPPGVLPTVAAPSAPRAEPPAPLGVDRARGARSRRAAGSGPSAAPPRRSAVDSPRAAVDGRATRSPPGDEGRSAGSAPSPVDAAPPSAVDRAASGPTPAAAALPGTRPAPPMSAAQSSVLAAPDSPSASPTADAPPPPTEREAGDTSPRATSNAARARPARRTTAPRRREPAPSSPVGAPRAAPRRTSPPPFSF